MQQQPAATMGAEEEAQPARLGCSHYARGCRVLAPCCNQWVGCRICHNEQIDDHEVDRHAIRSMQCLSCDTAQQCARECAKCGAVMGDYFCGVCNLFDNDGAKKKIFHCDDCGICRVGGRENFFHCARCCGCYPHSLNNRHRCVDGSMHRECAICLERTFDSLQTVNVLACGHVLHHTCYREYIRYGNVVCPTCRTSLLSTREQPQPRPNGDAAPNNVGGEGEAAAGDNDDEDDDGDDDGESDDDVDGDGDSDSDVSDADSIHAEDLHAAAVRAVAWAVAGDDDDGMAMQAVAWEAEGENDVEGLSESEDDDDERQIGRREQRD